jgi:hypothetical protein
MQLTSLLRTGLVGLAATVILAGRVEAIPAPCISNQTSIVQPGCVYVAPLPIKFFGVPDAVHNLHEVDLFDLRLRQLVGPPPTIGSFFDVFVEIDPPSPPLSLSGGATDTIVRRNPTGPLPDPLPTGTIDTEMVQLNLQSVGPPIIVRESPQLHSNGQATVTDLGGGLFQIDSFFDVFVELSLDNGQTFVPGQSSPTSGPTTWHLELTGIPEPTTLSLLGFGLAGLGLMRRRRAHG